MMAMIPWRYEEKTSSKDLGHVPVQYPLVIVVEKFAVCSMESESSQ